MPGTCQSTHEEAVVRVTTGVVANALLLVLWNLIELRHQVVYVERVELAVLLEEAVQVVDVSLMVLGVVNLHGLLVKVWLEGVIAVSQLGQRVRHGIVLRVWTSTQTARMFPSAHGSPRATDLTLGR